MIILNSTSDKAQLITSAAGSIDVQASGIDLDAAGAYSASYRKNTAITTATTTDITAVPGASTTRNLKYLAIRNKHASTSNTITVQSTDGTTIVEHVKCQLLAGEQLIHNDGAWFVLDSTGAIKGVSVIVVDPSVNDFRLTGVSATPVMTADSTSLSTIYLAQYLGNRIALYDGAQWQLYTPPSEVSLAVTGRTTDLPFDIFAYASGTTVTLEFLNWSSGTARTTGLTRVDGVWTKTGDATRRYLGSCRARSATTFHWVLNGDDLPCKLDLWNYCNRVATSFTLRALTNTWNYTTATWRQAQASANYQTDIMVGLQEEFFEAWLNVTSTNATTTIPREVGIGYDSTTAFSGLTASTTNEAAVASQQIALGRIRNQPSIGRHFYAWLEISTATGTTTWYGDNGALRIQSGMIGVWEC